MSTSITLNGSDILLFVTNRFTFVFSGKIVNNVSVNYVPVNDVPEYKCELQLVTGKRMSELFKAIGVFKVILFYGIHAQMLYRKKPHIFEASPIISLSNVVVHLLSALFQNENEGIFNFN